MHPQEPSHPRPSLQEMSGRFVRHFAALSVPPTSEGALRTIFTAVLGGFLDTYFPPGAKWGSAKEIVVC
jgi:hypothetical protein